MVFNFVIIRHVTLQSEVALSSLETIQKFNIQWMCFVIDLNANPIVFDGLLACVLLNMLYYNMKHSFC